jgi:hypothetical protein
MKSQIVTAPPCLCGGGALGGEEVMHYFQKKKLGFFN